MPLIEFAHALVRDPTALTLLAVFLAVNFVATIFLAWTPTLLVEKFHFKLTSAGLSGTVFIHLVSAASAPIGGFVAHRLARRVRAGDSARAGARIAGG